MLSEGSQALVQRHDQPQTISPCALLRRVKEVLSYQILQDWDIGVDGGHAVCRVDPINLNAWMGSNGWAVGYRRYSIDSVIDEKAARKAGKGLWRGKFVKP